MMGSLREARRVCSCNDIFSPKSSLVSSSGLLEYAAGQTGVHSLHKRRLPVEEPQLERAGGQRAGARVVRVQGPAPTAAGATARPRWRRSSPPAVTGPLGSVRRSGVVSRAGRVDPDAVVGERPRLAPRVAEVHWVRRVPAAFLMTPSSS